MNAVAHLLPIIARNHRSAAPTGPTRVDLVQRASGPTEGSLSSNMLLPTLSGVHAGDLIVVLGGTANGFNPSGVPTDSSLNSFNEDYGNTGLTRNAYRVYSAIASADTDTLAITFHNGASAYAQVVAAIYRAPPSKTWSFDNTNFSAATNGFTSTDITKTINTSGPGVVCVMCGNGNADSGVTIGAQADCNGADIQAECPANSTAAFGYLSFFGDHLADAALAGYDVTANIYNTTAGDLTVNKDLIVAPFTYS